MSSAHFITTEPSGLHSLNLLVEGMHCPSCVAIIENALIKQTAVQNARLNLSTKRLRIAWKGSNILGDKWIEMINGMGYHAVPFDPATAETSEIKEEKFLLRDCNSSDRLLRHPLLPLGIKGAACAKNQYGRADFGCGDSGHADEPV